MNSFRFVCVLLLLQSCQSRFEYQISVSHEEAVILDGEQNEKFWLKANALTDFSNPWHKEVSPETSLRMSRDSVNVYFFFEAKDSEIVLEPNLSDERGIEKEDRVELFFSRDKDMREYYCFEIDAMGRILSYRAQHYRKFDFSWDTPTGIKAVAKISDDGYSVEGAIPLSFLRMIGENDECFFGAYRAEFSRDSSALTEEWLTWKDSGTQQPDFHVPATLGKLSW